MKKAKSEPNDSLRPEYKRSDSSELVRGKYAVTQVELAQVHNRNTKKPAQV